MSLLKLEALSHLETKHWEGPCEVCNTCHQGAQLCRMLCQHSCMPLQCRILRSKQSFITSQCRFLIFERQLQGYYSSFNGIQFCQHSGLHALRFLSTRTPVDTNQNQNVLFYQENTKNKVRARLPTKEEIFQVQITFSQKDGN